MKRVIVDGTHASGVVIESSQSPEFGSRLDNSPTTTRAVKAKKMVVVSCGAFGTPLILQRSGIGDAQVLRRAGIEPINADLPGVGDGYQDHHEVSYAYKSSLTPTETLDGLANGTFNVEEMIANNDLMLGWNCMGVTCKVRPNDAVDISALGSKFQEAWEKEFASNPNKPLAIITQVNA